MSGGSEYRDPAAFNRWRELLAARDRPGANQEYLAPKEHGAWAELQARQSPILGPLSLLAAIPAYDLAKVTGALDLVSPDPNRTPASLDAMAESYRGLGRGVSANIGDFLSWAARTPPPAAMPTTVMPMSQRMSPEELQRFLARHRKR